MTEPSAKQRQMIDLDEFERRLSRSPQPARDDDPLAELARLVGGGEDRFNAIFQSRPAESRPPTPTPPQPKAPAGVPDWLSDEVPPRMPLSSDWQPDEPRARLGAAPARQNDFTAIEAGLRGSLPPDFRDFELSTKDTPEFERAESSLGNSSFPSSAADEAPRSRLPLYATAAVILAGMAGIGGTFALKRTPASPQQIALIAAPTMPVKVAAPAEAASNQSSNATILDNSPQPSPTAAVSHSEQPVDVNTVGQPAPVAAQSLPDAAQASQLASTTPADSVPVPQPPATDSGQGDLGVMMQPHKVKTIAIHPDSALDSAAPPPATSPSPSPPVSSIMPPSMATDYNVTPAPPASASQAPAAPPAAPAAPVSDTPAPKTASASDDLPWSSQADQGAAAAPAAASPEPPAAKPERIARAETGDAGVADTISHGGFSVQLAAPATQVEAHAALLRLTHAYGAELRGYRLKFRQAKVADKTVFRVRVGGLSRNTAISLCEKLKAKGGACFIAHD